ncbi:alpha/beta-hydrolase [Rhizopus microsporus]|uniref:Alpha/beta-hydrolase n=1 Tax=Rhizopus microsporus TaxID=58291 RepID=A0A1X0S274_RHIZD|nr:alpha/beta-hydrolase [Rhizopus microsporus]
MDDIRLLIKRNSPPALAVQTIRSALAMNPTACRSIINDFTRPLKEQKRFIRKFDNEYWKGSLIMSEMIRCDDETALKRLQKADIVIFEIHGGGFRAGHRLAPKYKYPEPVHQCVSAYNYLTNHLGVSPSKVVLSGDSAGGALVIETLIRTYAPGILDNLDAPRTNFDLPLPAAALLSSPLVSPETTQESWKKYEKKDIISLSLAKSVFKEYLDLPNVKMEDLPILRISQINNKFDRFLPKNVLVIAGTKEVLYDSIVQMVDFIKQDGKINLTFLEENLLHDWFLIHEVISKKDKGVIQKYDELFVDFAVKAVKEARRALTTQTKETVPEPLKNSSNNNIDVDSVQEKIIPEIIEKLDTPFVLLEDAKFPKPETYKPNTILSDYAIVSDEPSANPNTAVAL